MRKLGRVAGLVVNVGESCQKYNLRESDLPSGLRTTLKSLQIELSGVGSALKQSAEIGTIRKVLLRKDLLRKVKQYDGELSNVLQTFQAELALDSRFAQIAAELKIIHPDPSVPFNMVMPVPQEPSAPQTFFGRDAELAEIIHMIFTGIGSRPARIVILGPGGYGKTTLANAVLTHPRVQNHFESARYFVACESVSSSGALLVELAKTLGILDGTSDASWSHIHATLNSKDSIICLDNFESPWDQSSDTRHSVEKLLSRITGLHHVTLLVTMRGSVRPGQTQWTKPVLAPLKTLSQDAAKEIWEEIGDNFDDAAEELIKAVDYVPLAVTLLAHLSQATLPSLLLKEWNQKQTKFIQMGQSHKLSNLEYSIQLSIESGSMKANPSAKDLLGILSMLPDGIHTKHLEIFQEILVDMDLLSSLRILQQCSLVNVIGERYQTHPIIRHFCNHQNFISANHKKSLQEFYINLASSESYNAQAQKHAEMVLEVNNTKATLLQLLNSNYKDHSKLVKSILTFTFFHASIGDLSDKLISQTFESLQERKAITSLLVECLQTWGKLYYFASDFENAKYKAQEAERLCSSGSNNISPLHAAVLTDLSELCLFQGALDEAEASYKKVLELHKIANNLVGQGNSYKGLGDTYLRLGKLHEAEASYKKALECHKLTDGVLGQGNDHKGLGDIYVQLNKPVEAEASYKKALEFHKIANDALWQGNDHLGLGDTYLQMRKPDEAKASYNMALEFHRIANNALGRGNDYRGLGDMYLQLKKLDDAEASYKKALEFHKIANNALGQGNDCFGLGGIYLQLKKLDEAEASYKMALEFHKSANNVLGQGSDYRGLGSTYLQLKKLDEAEASYRKALEFHKIANSTLGQGNDHKGFGDIYLLLRRFGEAEASYQKALEYYKIANSVLGQGNALHGLGKAYMERSQLEDAKVMFEKALTLHKQVQEPIWQRSDEEFLDRVLSKMGHTTKK
ncbi:hypothetical protein B0F90DRAFT_369567 [Multifurca ochricompacta]|uniref:NB-ARC domain-containing protein n=1 Tax=Multifurca ochricompacta TaxID=376703 RepID=A0AAD4QJ88_9AGAM|nr:hypothetical protein B0F90DRAFT_369567 [Multifurca ochricompacta]